MKKVSIKLIAVGALMVAGAAKAEVIELTFNSAILTYATESTEEYGRFAKRLNEQVTFSQYSDSREKGRRAVNTSVHQSIVQGQIALGVDRRTLTKTFSINVTWSPEEGKNCRVNQSIAVQRLPMKHEKTGGGCNFYLAIKKVDPFNNGDSRGSPQSSVLQRRSINN